MIGYVLEAYFINTTDDVNLFYIILKLNEFYIIY